VAVATVCRGGANEPLQTKPDKSVATADTTCFRRYAVQLFSPNNRLTDNFTATVRHQVGEILRISCLHGIRHTKTPQTGEQIKIPGNPKVAESDIIQTRILGKVLRNILTQFQSSNVPRTMEANKNSNSVSNRQKCKGPPKDYRSTCLPIAYIRKLSGAVFQK